MTVPRSPYQDAPFCVLPVPWVASPRAELLGCFDNRAYHSKGEPLLQITAGDNLTTYQGEVTTRQVDLTTSKYVWNSIIKPPGTWYIGTDAGNFYLVTPMDRYKYMRIRIKLTPQSFIDKYNLMSKVKIGYVCCEIVRGIYRSPQAGKCVNDVIKSAYLKRTILR